MLLQIMAVLIWLWLGAGDSDRVAARRMMPAQSSEQIGKSKADLKLRFDDALKKGGSLYRSSAELHYFEPGGFGFTYCFEYQDSRGSQDYQEIRLMVENYHGRLH